MKASLRKAQAELEKQKRKKRRQEGGPDHGNNMSKAQSQDMLVLVNPFPLLALRGTQIQVQPWGVGSPHLPAVPFAGFSPLGFCRALGEDGGTRDRVFPVLSRSPCFERPRKSPSFCPTEGQEPPSSLQYKKLPDLCLSLPQIPPSNEVRVNITL